MLLIFLVNMHGLFLQKIEKGITITNVFRNFLDKSNHKPNKMWLDKGSEFYNRSMKSFLQNNNKEMYPTHNEEKPVVAERFIRTLTNKIYKYIVSILKNVFIDKLDNILNNHKSTYHRTIKMKPVDEKPSFNKENNKESYKFKGGGNVTISKYKDIFNLKDYS